MNIAKIYPCSDRNWNCCRQIKQKLTKELEEKTREASILDEIVTRLRKELNEERQYTEKLEKELSIVLKREAARNT